MKEKRNLKAGLLWNDIAKITAPYFDQRSENDNKNVAES
jgi:hypothetical protein